jgi:vitamin B12 transporter
MRYTFKVALLAVSSILALPAHAEEEEVIVTASRSGGVERELLGASVSTFTAEDLEQRQIRNVVDILNEAPSSNVSRQGALGGLTAVRLRGAEGNHTLVLIDGIEANDPFQGEFDFAALIADELARVEILRGQQSALYGSDAIGGVIHYITASGREAAGFSARVEGGAFGTLAASARLGGAGGRFEGAVAASAYSTEGTNISRSGDEEDGYETRALSARGSFDVTEALSLRAVVRVTHSEGDTDDASFGAPVDGPDHYAYNAFYGLAGVDLSLLNDAWTHALTLQYVDGRRRDYSPFFLNFVDGAREKASYVTAYRFGGANARHTLTGAIDYERETYQNVSPPGMFTPPSALEERVLETTGLVLAYDVALTDRIGIGLAARHDSNSRFEDADTYRAQASWRATDALRLRGAVGAGVKNPTNYELFGFDPPFFVGNPDLEPEVSRGWELGADYDLHGGAARLGLTYFQAELGNEIAGGFFSTPINLDTPSRQRGVEASLTARIGDNWRLDASYAWLDAEQDGVREIRRPEHSGSIALFWRADSDRGGAGFAVRYAGAITDDDFSTFPAARVRLDGFTTVTLTADWRLTDHVEVFARVENAADKTYEQVVGFRGPERGAFAGLRASY